MTTSARFFLEIFSCSSWTCCGLPVTSGLLGLAAGAAAINELDDEADPVALQVLALLLLLLLLFRFTLAEEVVADDDFFSAARVADNDDEVVEDDDDEEAPFRAALDIAALSFCNVA